MHNIIFKSLIGTTMKFQTLFVLGLSVFGVFTSAANHEVKMLNSGVRRIYGI